MIWIILIYLISVILFIDILIRDAKNVGIEITYNDLWDFYGFDLIFAIVPLINTAIVILWYAVQLYYKLTDHK